MLNSVDKWWRQKLEDGRLLPEDTSYRPEIESSKLADDFAKLPANQGFTRRQVEIRLGVYLRAVCPRPYPIRKQPMTKGVRRHILEFPSSIEDLKDLNKAAADKVARVMGTPAPSPTKEESKPTSVTGLVATTFAPK